MFQEGSHIGPYTIRRRLGAGGMGEVYLGEHRYLERRAAIKVLLPELSMNAEVVSRFFTEARAASRIEHPGIVQIVDCDRHQGGEAYIVMELLEGESLGDHLARLDRLDSRSAIGIAGGIASPLQAAHSKGIVHRDLKPDNVFLARPQIEGNLTVVKILDFGIAKLATDGAIATRKTRTGSLLGTPLYMSPEQCRGSGLVDHRADIYSLGCILFEMLCGRPPFVRDGAGELFAAHLSEPVPDMTAFVAVPPGLEALTMRMLEKDPGRRPQSMDAVVRELERHAGLREAEFATLIQSPGRPPVSGKLASDVGADSPPPGSPFSALSGGTMVAKKQTTLGHTASELTPMARVPSRRLFFVAGGGVAAASIAAGLLWTAGRSPLAGDVGAGGQKEDPASGVGAPASEGSRASRVGQVSPAPDVVAAGGSPPADPSGSDVEIQIVSTPDGAEVWFADEREARGRTPLVVRLDRDAQPARVTLKALGHIARVIRIDPLGESRIAVALEEEQQHTPAPRGPRAGTPGGRATRAVTGSKYESVGGD
jgi:eukaryotic-like serine/threonine-protein kinase